ncbi:hypothetical protein LBMAG53_09590 [Planctomycetota bacterium]|nr:hypothetical protein LBMAG53_09590 [Planctomycetota bacterium]
MPGHELAALPDDPRAFADEIQKLAATGDFNPFSLLAGQAQFHSVFIAPFSPALKSAVDRFLADGSGPLNGTVEQLASQGLSPVEAAQHARQLFQHALGMVVTVLATDHGVAPIPQLFFGHFHPDWKRQAITACGPDFAHGEALAASLGQLETLAGHGRRFPLLFSGPHAGSDYWPTLAGEVVATAEDSLFPGGRERLADLAHWCGAALASEKGKTDAELLTKIHLLAGETDRACAALERMEAAVVAGNGDDEAFVEAVNAVVESAVGLGRPQPILAWLAPRLDRIDTALGGSYDLTLAQLKLAAAAGDGIGPAIDRLVARNRKLARHDLTKEPIWRVVVEPGELIEVGAAAEQLGRPVPWVTKRLESRTIPHHVAHADGKQQVRLPSAALTAWKAALDAHKLLD